MRKPAFCKCENKGAEQLRAADQWLCFRFTYSAIDYYLNLEFQAVAVQSGFLSGLVGNSEDRFSGSAAHVDMESQASLLPDRL